MQDGKSLPDGLATMAPGPQLGAVLATLELGALPDAQLAEVLSAASRQQSHDTALKWAVMAEIGSRDPMLTVPGGRVWTAEERFESGVDEIRAELIVTPQAARHELERAESVASMPRVAQALSLGVIDEGRAVVLADGCRDLTEEQKSKLLDEVLPGAAKVTAYRLAQRVKRVAIALDPKWAERRYREAVRTRRVVRYLNEDGTATVSAQYLEPDQAAAAYARIDAVAKAAKRAGAHAPTDHLRVELFAGLLDGRFHGLDETAIIAELQKQFPRAADNAPPEPGYALAPCGVHLQVGLGTLIGLDEQPAELAGLGTVLANVARRVVARQHRSEWRYAIVDAQGRPLFDGLTRRRPTSAATSVQAVGGIVELHVPVSMLGDADLAREHPEWADLLADLARQHAKHQRPFQDPTARFPGRPLRRQSQITFQTCIFPSCGRPAVECEQDHRRDYAYGGRTDPWNLTPACSHDHDLKTKGGWRLIRRSEFVFVWISPLGRKHVVEIPAIAPPLPKPQPRPLEPERELPDLTADDDQGEEAAPGKGSESDPDPPF